MKFNGKLSFSTTSIIAKPVSCLGVLVIGLGISGGAAAGNNFVSNARLPGDVKPTCEVNIAPWFGGGTVTANGWVEPANSEKKIFGEFDTNTRCDFYKWGAQMFLWLTSGAGDRHVFSASPNFYNISVARASKTDPQKSERNFLPGDGTLDLTVSIRKGDDIELGQASGFDVLLSQQKSLIYYAMHANDIFAMYTTCWRQPSCNLSKDFPSTPEEVKGVQKFAADYGYTISDPRPMAMELKTSWVDASTVGNKQDYITTMAKVPTFDRTKPTTWPVNGSTTIELAMVGMHVVGTVDKHPEMIWSTFEHVNNVPDNAYVYTSNVIQGGNNLNQTQPYNSKGNWVFLPSGANKPTQITPNAKSTNENASSTKTTSIDSISGAPIAPVDVIRVDPWGNLHGSTSDTDVANNTDLASINYSVLSQLKDGDVRGNYIQTGGVWTAKGQIPNSVNGAVPGTDPNLRGSLHLANTTMETFDQYKTSGFNPINCFGCHNGGDKAVGTDISHIFDALQALPKKMK